MGSEQGVGPEKGLTTKRIQQGHNQGREKVNSPRRYSVSQELEVLLGTKGREAWGLNPKKERIVQGCL